MKLGDQMPGVVRNSGPYQLKIKLKFSKISLLQHSTAHRAVAREIVQLRNSSEMQASPNPDKPEPNKL